MKSSNEITPQQLAELTQKFLKGGHTLKGLRGISDESMETLYGLAHSHYNGGRYQEAITLFNFLSLHDPFKKKYWIGLGASRQLVKDYEGAVLAYSMAGITQVGDPHPALYAADCYLLLGKKELAEKALTAAAYWAEQKPEYKSIKERADSCSSSWEQRKTSTRRKRPRLPTNEHSLQ